MRRRLGKMHPTSHKIGTPQDIAIVAALAYVFEANMERFPIYTLQTPFVVKKEPSGDVALM